MPLGCLQGSEVGRCISTRSNWAVPGKQVDPILGLLVAVAGAIIL
jgi:hypothetical protein